MPITKVGTFKIETSFNITNRGIVLMGQIFEGTLLAGYCPVVGVLQTITRRGWCTKLVEVSPATTKPAPHYAGN